MKKISGVLITTIMLMIVLYVYGCKNYRHYEEAKKIMSHCTTDPHAGVKNAGDPYTCYEQAAALFDRVNDYRDSKKLAKEARYLAAGYFYENRGRYFYDKGKNDSESYLISYLIRAYQLLLQVGEYKDASDIAKNVKTELYAIAMTDVKKNVEKTNNDGANRTDDDNHSIDEIFKILKHDDISALQEKLYSFVHDNIDNPNFWNNAGTPGLYTELYGIIFQKISDYKDASKWRERLVEAYTIPTIDGDSLKKRTDRIGINPQPRTVIASFGGENDSPLALTRKIRALKQEMKGNIFFTDNIEQACAIIHYKKSYDLWKTFNYSLGREIHSPVDYYNTTVTVKIISVNGKVLYSKSLLSKFSKSYESLPYNTAKKLYATPKDVNIAELAKVLEKEFAQFPAPIKVRN